MRRWGAAVAAAVLAVVALLGSGPVSAQDSTPVSAASGCRDPGIHAPVLLVHGWNSDANTWKKATAQDALFNRDDNAFDLSVSRFVYGADGNDLTTDKDLSLDWVTDPGIGHSLAATITCLAAASTRHGGVGRVSLVAHSMGGLAIRCALDTTCNGGVPDVRSKVAVIVTFGTPNLGSFLRGDAASSAAESQLAEALELSCVSSTNPDVIDVHQPGVLPLCRYIRRLGDGPAAVAFTPGSSELTALPTFNPPGAVAIPVREDAGQVAVSTSLGTLWHHTINGDVGDLIVGTKSATSQARTVDGIGGDVRQPCGELDLSASAAAIGVPGSGLFAENLAAGVTCSHLSETSDGAFLTDAFATIQKWGRRHDPSVAAVREAAGVRHASSPVEVPGGFEAAAWDDHTHISFWRWTPSTLRWDRLGGSTYPYIPGNGPPSASVQGALLEGAQHAVFLADGPYTGDGSGNTVAFSSGPRGWGVVGPDDHGTMVPSGTGGTDNATPGLRFGIRFVDHHRETIDLNPFFSTAGGGLFPLRTEWSWQSDHFVSTSDNRFTADGSAGPPTLQGNWPAAGCPRDGTYIASFGVRNVSAPDNSRTNSLTLEVMAPSSAYDAGACSFTVSADAPLLVQAAHKEPDGTPAGIRWISAPLWLLDTDGLLAFDLGPLELSADLIDAGSSPYVVPSTLHVDEMLSVVGQPDNGDATSISGGAPVPAYGSVTVSGGQVVGAALLSGE